MTWTAQVEVTDVIETEDHEIMVECRVDAGDTWTSPYDGKQYPALTSNTEGQIAAINVSFTIDGPVGVKVGDRLQISGHFVNTAPTQEQSA